MKNFSRREFIPLVGLTLLGTSCLSANRTEEPAQKTKWLPKALKKGDTIGVCAPAGSIKEEGEVTEFINLLGSFGFKVKSGRNVFSRYGYFSAPDKERAEEFMEMICDKEVQAVFFIRGGWGCARILDLLDYELIRSNPKVIMGFSDLTSLLNSITEKTGLITFHGPGGNSTWNDFTMKSFQQLIENDGLLNYNCSDHKADWSSLSKGKAKGDMLGGNLSVICTLLGTDYEPDWNGKLLFIEEVKEEPYRIDRMLTQLAMNGVFEKVNGVILGQFRECIAEEVNRSFTLDEVLRQHFSHLSIPVIYGIPFGHVKDKLILPIGIQSELDAENGVIRTLESAVSA